MEDGKDVERVPDDGSVVEQSLGALYLPPSFLPSSPLPSSPLPSSPWQSVRSLIDISWWRDAVTTAISFAPSCVAPAVFSALSGAVVNTALIVSMDRLRVNPVQFTDLLLSIAVLLLGTVLGLAFMVLGFGGWLFRLAAYSIALVKAPSLAYVGALSKDDRKAWLKAAIVEVEPKKAHIGAVLLWVTIYMLFPLFIVLSCTAVKMITMPGFMGAMALKLPGWIDVACAVAALPNFLFLLIYSFVTLVVAACASLKAQHAAHLAFKLSWKYFWPLSIVSVFFAVLSIALGAPSDLLQMMAVDKVLGEYNPNTKIASHVWSSLVGILLFPLSFTPICDILRAQLRNDLLAVKTIGVTETSSSQGIQPEGIQSEVIQPEGIPPGAIQPAIIPPNANLEE